MSNENTKILEKDGNGKIKRIYNREMKAHFFDIETLIDLDCKAWIIDKVNPGVPLLRISKSDFNLIKNGIYRTQNNKVEFNGKTFWIPTDLLNKLKVLTKSKKVEFGNLAISLQEFQNKDIIDNIHFDIKEQNINHLKNSKDDIYIICSKQTARSYHNVIDKLKEKLKDIGLEIKSFYYINETFYNINEDEVKFKKTKLLLQHLVGYRTDINKFTDQEITMYQSVTYYDNNYDTLKMKLDINVMLDSLLKNSEEGIRSVVKENIKEYHPILYINQINDNELNKIIKDKVIISYSNLIKSFESFDHEKY